MMKNRKLTFMLSLFVLAVVFWGRQEWWTETPLEAARAAIESSAAPVSGYTVVNRYPHDRAAFTQGLVYEDGILYESTGLHEQSTLRQVNLKTGEVIRLYRLPARFFGEGITVWRGKIFQLTWKSGTGFIYEKDSFALQREFGYPMQGWGMTHDGRYLIISDGTSELYFLDPQTLEVAYSIQVADGARPVPLLNELEWIDGEIFANIWQTDYLARIDPDTGQVMGWVDLSGLLSLEEYGQADVLNGIAYDAQGNRLFITGKRWPWLFEIRLTGGIMYRSSGNCAARSTEYAYR